MPRAIEVHELPGVEAALATRDPVACARQIADILAEGADRREVVHTAALASARHFAPAVPPPRALLALAASLDLAAKSTDPARPVVQACALAASEWRDEPLEAPAHAITGDEIHLGRSFLAAVRAADAPEADALFTGLLREGDERRLAGDVLFEACAQDLAGDGQKLPFAVGSWRLARTLDWGRGADLLRPAVRVAASVPQDFSDSSASLREAGRSRLDLELAARNVAPVDAVARNTFGIALSGGPDRVVADLVASLKRGRTPAGYADLIATTAAERLIGEPQALEPALFALAVRFVLGFSRTATHVLGVFQAARAVARVRAVAMPPPARISDPEIGLRDLEAAIEEREPVGAARLALGLVDATEPDAVAHVLIRQAAIGDAHADGGLRLPYAAWATEFAKDAPAPALASLAAVLARGPMSRAVAEAL